MAFFDVENLDSMSIGKHETADGVDYFQGNIDDVYLYGRALGQDEINYLYDLVWLRKPTQAGSCGRLYWNHRCKK